MRAGGGRMAYDASEGAFGRRLVPTALKMRTSTLVLMLLAVATLLFYIACEATVPVQQQVLTHASPARLEPVRLGPPHQASRKQDPGATAYNDVGAEKRTFVSLSNQVPELPEVEEGPADGPDDSVRCRMAGICESSKGYCFPGPDRLGCVRSVSDRKDAVKEAILWGWQGYKHCAWGADEVQPVACKGIQSFNLGLTIVDSLDTLILAGLDKEVQEALSFIRTTLDVSHQSLPKKVRVNLFETTIRVLGGLLSATHLLQGSKTTLVPAVEVGLRLMCAFKTPFGVPHSDVSLSDLSAHQPAWTQFSSLAEVGTLALEYGYLAHVLSNAAILTPAMHVYDVLRGLDSNVADGLYPMFVDIGEKGPPYATGDFTLGARADSFYEYLLKRYIAGGKKERHLLDMYRDSMRGVRRHLISQTGDPAAGGLVYAGERMAPGRKGRDGNGLFRPKMDHLVCFLPGLLAYGSLHGVETAQHDDTPDLVLAQQLMWTCYELYRETPSGLSPEIAYYNEPDRVSHPKAHTVDIGAGNFYVKPADTHNLLRPETVESLFVLWRVTGNETYREWGWQIFRAFELQSKVASGGYTCLSNVLDVHPSQEHRDKMESFMLAEALKYLLLLFEDTDVIPLHSYVFNTEAHPLPIEGSDVDLADGAWYIDSSQFWQQQRPVEGSTDWLEKENLLQLIDDFKAAMAD